MELLANEPCVGIGHLGDPPADVLHVQSVIWTKLFMGSRITEGESIRMNAVIDLNRGNIPFLSLRSRKCPSGTPLI